MPNKVLTVVVPSNPVEVITIRVPGQQGPGGVQGSAGPSNVLTIGTVSSLAEGASATATISGVSPTQTLNLGIPRGATGVTGPPANLSIGTITTSAPGGSAAASLTGSAPNYTLNLTLPRGYGVPSLGSANQVLIKNSSTDYDTSWLSFASASTANTIMSRDGSGDSAVRYLSLGGTTPTAGQAIRRDFFEDQVATAATGDKIVRRYPDGTASINMVYLSSAPTGSDHATRKDYVDAVGATAATPSTIVRRDASGDIYVVDAYGSAAPTAPNQLTRKDYVDAQAATRTRQYVIPESYPGGAGRQYVRLATLDGVNANGGADLEMILSGQGDIGAASRGTYLISFTQRGDNITSVKAWAWGHDATQNKLNLYTKQISTFVFELWGQFSPYNNSQALHVLSGSNYTINIDSGTATTPSGLSSAYSIYDYDTEITPLRNSTSTGRSVLTATDGAAARSAIGAGTSNLAIGTTSTTAKAGDYSPPAATESVSGISRFATSAESTAGTLSTVSVHPAGLAASLVSFGRDRGTGTTLPSTDLRVEDTYRHTSFGLFFYNGTAWRQIAPLEITSTQRLALATGNAALYVGFQVYETDTRRTWVWEGSTYGWIYTGGGIEPTQLLTVNTGNFNHYATANGNTSGFKYEKLHIQRKVGGGIRVQGLIQVTTAINGATWYQLVTAPNFPSYANPADRVITYHSINGTSSLFRVDVIPNNSNFGDTVPATLSAYAAASVAVNSIIAIDIEYNPANAY